jgi:riboflavin biosynthesis pyrimidine reductase
MEVILHMAMSLDGMVARENDDTDFLAHDNWTLFVELARQTGALIWGRRTHELVRGYGASFLVDLNGLGRVVVSGDAQLALEPGWQRAASPEQAVALLEDAGHKRTLVVGGAALNTAFAQAGLVDAVILNVESVIVGHGIPLFAPAPLDLRLQLLAVQRVREEIVQLHYRVPR